LASATTLRRRLVRQLEEKGLLRDRRVRQAFLEVPREQFVSTYAERHGLEAVYRDEAIVTKQTEAGQGLSSSSQPAIMAEMLDELRLEPGQRVLEIGAGTGYNAALLAHVVGDRGRVVSVELDPDTASGARRALQGTGVEVVHGDGRDGHVAGAPYDRVVATASADAIPRAWLEQLAPGGLLEVPLRLRASSGLQLIPTLRRDNGRFRSVSVIVGGFMPLRSSPEDREPYWPMLNVSLSAGADRTMLFSLSDESLRGLSDGALRKLLRAISSVPTTRRLGVRADTKSLALYVTVCGPARRIVGAFDGRSYCGGLVGRRHSGVALLDRWPSTTRMLVYGDGEAADELTGLVEEWSARGRPTESDLELAVRFDGDRSRLRTSWRGH